jgi:uncharacterized membrane protein YczE
MDTATACIFAGVFAISLGSSLALTCEIAAGVGEVVVCAKAGRRNKIISMASTKIERIFIALALRENNFEN